MKVYNRARLRGHLINLQTLLKKTGRRMIRRSAIVSIAITLGQLVAGQRSGWTDDQKLVLDALRRSTTRLNDATDQELADYLTSLTQDQMRGVTSNVKGIFHESEFIQDGLVSSALIVGALQARALLVGQSVSPEQMRSHLELAGIGIGTAVTVDALLSIL